MSEIPQYLSNDEIKNIKNMIFKNIRYKKKDDDFSLEHFDYILNGKFLYSTYNADPADICVKNLYIKDKNKPNHIYRIICGSHTHIDGRGNFVIKEHLNGNRDISLEYAVKNLFPLMLKASKAFSYKSVIKEFIESVKNQRMGGEAEFLHYDIVYELESDKVIIDYIRFPTSKSYKVKGDENIKHPVHFHDNVIYMANYIESCKISDLEILLEWLAIRYINKYDEITTDRASHKKEKELANKHFDNLTMDMNRLIDQESELDKKISELNEEIKKLTTKKQELSSMINEKQEIIENYKYFVSLAK